MTLGEAIAMGFSGGSVVTLLGTLLLLRRAYRLKIEEAARVLGIGRRMASELDRQGKLTGALGFGHPAVISPKALEILLGFKSKSESSSTKAG